MVFATEGLGARRADERPLVGVRSNVDLEVVRLGELALAEAADVLSSTGSATRSTAAVSSIQHHCSCSCAERTNRK